MFNLSYLPHSQEPLKLPEIELDDDDYLFMIKSPLAVGAVIIHMDPESIASDTSFGGCMANTFQGVATLTTPAGPLKTEGARWHFFAGLQFPGEYED